MAIENVQQLLTEQLGKGTVEIFEGAVTGKDFYAVHFPVTSVVSAITAANATGESALQTTMPAGTTLFMNITALTITSGVAIGYVE
tara:strand:- start:2692 stop:2949 length:258 start_codon:yes stop_codon:yes gene_type:complete